MSTSRRVTINDIARISGYSKTSVSFAFNEPGRISVKAREAILKAAEELGYIPDPLARNFSLQRHHTIGILLPHLINSALRNPFITQVIQGVGSVCQKYGYTLTLIPPLNESVSDAVRAAAVDGLITLGMEAEMKVVQIIQRRKIPYVTIDGSPSADMPSINIKDRSAARDAVISLMESEEFLGLHDSVTDFRMSGYSDALAEYGLCFDASCVTIIPAACTMEGGRSAASQFMQLEERPTALVCMSDIIAIGMQQELQALGIQIPDEVSLVGFDNIIESALVTPSLTTVDQPGGEKGRQAAELIFQLIRGDDIPQTHIIVPYRIVERESLGVILQEQT